MAAKYSAAEMRAMLAKGQAMRNAQGEPSFPIADKADLQNAIHAVGRAGKDHDAVRAFIIKRAKALGATDMLPDSWKASGKVKGS